MNGGKDFYNVLGVKKDATEKDIIKAYRALALKFHPDKQGGSDAKMKEIGAAFELLKDKNRRANYDQAREAVNVDPDAGSAASA